MLAATKKQKILEMKLKVPRIRPKSSVNLTGSSQILGQGQAKVLSMSVGSFLSLLLFFTIFLGKQIDATESKTFATENKSSEDTIINSDISLNTSERSLRMRRPSPEIPLPATPPIPSSLPRQRRFIMPFLCCFHSNQAVVSTSVMERTTRAQRIQRFKEAIDADNQESLELVIDTIPTIALYSTPSIIFENRSAIYYTIFHGKFIAFKVILEHLCGSVIVHAQDFFLQRLLTEAIKCDQLKFVTYLIDRKGAVISADQKLFHLVISHKASIELLKYLFSAMDLSLLDAVLDSVSGDSVWHTTVRHQNLPAFLFLHEMKFRFSFLAVPNAQGFTPVQLLLESQNVLFFESIADTLPTFVSRYQDNDYNTLAHLAAQINSVAALNSVLNRVPFLINSVNLLQRTPLALAVLSNSLETARYLLERGADVLSIDAEGFSILQLCLASASRHSIELLIEILHSLNRAQPHALALRQAFQHLLSNSLWKEAETLLSKFRELWIQHFDMSHLPPAYLATTLITLDLPLLFDFELQRGLISAHSTIPGEGRSLLHVAALAGNPFFISRLLECDAYFLAVDSNLDTPFDVAMRANNREAMKAALLSGKASIPPDCRQQKFKALLLNGGSFVSYRPNRLQFSDFLPILKLFERLFTLELKKLSFSDSVDAGARTTASTPTELVIYCMQFELFLAYHVKPDYLRNHFVIAKLKAIAAYRKNLASRMIPYSGVADLVQLFSPAIHKMVEPYLENISTDMMKLSDNLIPVSEQNEVFIQIFLDYSALFNP